MSLGQRLAVLGLAAGAVLWVSPEARASAGELLAELGGDHASAAPGPAPAGRAANPVPGSCVSSTYGPRWGTYHYGTDYAAPLGAPIRAVLAGVVTYSGPAQGYGQMIRVRSVGAGAPVLEYGHMRTRLARKGDRVAAGEVIARVGREGESTGPHLHLRVYPEGEVDHQGVDPARWLAHRGVVVARCG